MIFGGVDTGSRLTKAVLWDAERGIVAAAGSVEHQVDQGRSARQLIDRLLAEAALPFSALRRTIATGYGRNLVEFAETTVTEMTCHARGVVHGHPSVRTIVEIGGQDSKLIRLDDRSRVRDFMMNDRCAAGTGRFLEMVAVRLGVPLDTLGSLAGQSREPAVISSMCVVFAESEIIGLLSSGRLPADIVAGVQTSIATRVASMAGRGVEPPVHFTGGVALVPGMADALSRVLEQPVSVVPNPLFTGALGAALLAATQTTV